MCAIRPGFIRRVNTRYRAWVPDIDGSGAIAIICPLSLIAIHVNIICPDIFIKLGRIGIVGCTPDFIKFCPSAIFIQHIAIGIFQLFNKCQRQNLASQ